MDTAIGEDRLSETFAALANSTRRAILARLAEGEATVNELAEPFELTLPAVSKHIKVLERAGLVVRGHRAQYRPCALDAAPLEEVSTWAEQLPAGLGGPVRPDGRLPRASSDRDEGRRPQ